MRIVFDKNVPVGVRSFLSKHEVHTFVEMQWHPQLENGELLTAAEASGFDVLVTSDQNIRHQQNLTGRKIAFVVIGNQQWPTLRRYVDRVVVAVNAAAPGSFTEVEIPIK